MARMTRTKTKKRTTVNRTVPTVVAYDEEGSSPPPSASVVDSIETHELVKPREVVNEIGPILTTEYQVVQYVNELLLHYNPQNDRLYEPRIMVSTEIVEEICRYTTYFGEKTSGVSSWCSNRGLNYSKVESDRKRSRDSQGRKCRRRYLHILKDAYRGNLVSGLVNVIPKHQSRLKTWKADNYQVIGYVCRSPKEENEQDRINILQTMVGHLVVRHLIDKVFVSSQSKISDLLSERDKETQQEFMEKLTGVNGDTQEMIRYLEKSTTKVCLVVLGYEGFSNNCKDIKEFLRTHRKLEKIVIDNLPNKCEVRLLERQDILKNPTHLKVFESA